MTRELNEDEQALLARLLDGSLSLEDPAAKELLERSPELRKHYEQLALVVAGIKTLAQENEAAGQEAVRTTSDTDRRQVTDRWPSQGGAPVEDRTAPSPRVSKGWALALAAAAVVVAMVVWRGMGSEAEPYQRARLASDFDLQPSGEVDGFTTFSIRPKAAPGTRVLFVVFDDSGQQEIARSEVVGSEWAPSAEDRAKMEAQGALLWEFRFTDPLQSRVVTGSARATLRVVD